MASWTTSILSTYKAAYRDHPKAIWLISGITLINRTGTMVIPFLSVYLTTVLEYSLITAGYIMGAFGVGSIVGSYFGGKLTDWFGANIIIGLSLITGGLSFIAMQYFDSIVGLILIIFLTATFADAFRPAMSSFVGHHSPQGTAGRSMALMRIAINLGMALGPALGGFIAVYWSYNSLFWIDGITCILAGITFWLCIRWLNIEDTSSKRRQSIQTNTSPKPKIYQDKKYVRMLVISFLLALAFLQYFHTVPVYVKTIWGFDERYIGAMMAINCGLIVIIEMPMVDVLEKANKIMDAMKYGLILFLGAFIPFYGGSSLILYLIAVLFFTFGEILFLPFNNAYALNLSPEDNRGEYMSWYWMTWGAASVLAPIIGFQLANRLGYPLFWTCILGLLCLAILLHIRSERKGF